LESKVLAEKVQLFAEPFSDPCPGFWSTFILGVDPYSYAKPSLRSGFTYQRAPNPKRPAGPRCRAIDWLSFFCAELPPVPLIGCCSWLAAHFLSGRVHINPGLPPELGNHGIGAYSQHKKHQGKQKDHDNGNH
jgi:hypothetical protein